jgi:hypothetical protein
MPSSMQEDWSLFSGGVSMRMRVMYSEVRIGMVGYSRSKKRLMQKSRNGPGKRSINC